MGCDIHVTAQVKRYGKWFDAQEWENPHGYPIPKGGELFGNRNYALFGILAGVRTKVPKPLAERRGLPDDLSAEMQEFHEDNHSATWFTVAEILAYDWTQSLPRGGWVDPFEWARWRDRGKPDSWSGGVGGGTVRHLDKKAFEDAWVALRTERDYPEQRRADAHLRPLSSREHPDLTRFVELIGGGSPYTYVEWEQPYYEVSGELFSKTLPLALRLGQPEDVRFVVSFDS